MLMRLRVCVWKKSEKREEKKTREKKNNGEDKNEKTKAIKHTANSAILEQIWVELLPKRAIVAQWWHIRVISREVDVEEKGDVGIRAAARAQNQHLGKLNSGLKNAHKDSACKVKKNDK